MTQEDREGFKKSNPYPSVAMNVDENRVSQDKSPSPELFEMIQAAASSLTGFAQLWESIRKKGNSEGFSDLQLQWLLRPLLKDKLGMSKDKIYYLFHKEEKAEQNREAYEKKGGLIRQIDEKKELEHKTPIPPKDPDPEPPDEEPTELELANIRIAQLEAALKKTEQFKPASARIERSDDFDEYGTNETKVFEWLGKRDNGVNCYWYPNYGIELFRNRILTQLKNKGVTTFKRLYFEV